MDAGESLLRSGMQLDCSALLAAGFLETELSHGSSSAIVLLTFNTNVSVRSLGCVGGSLSFRGKQTGKPCYWYR